MDGFIDSNISHLHIDENENKNYAKQSRSTNVLLSRL